VSKLIACSDCNGLKDIAVTLFSQCLSTMVRYSSERASSLLVKDRASSSTSPIRWEAYLPRMNPGWMSPIWGCSMYSHIIGNLGYCNLVDPLATVHLLEQLVDHVFLMPPEDDDARFCTKILKILSTTSAIMTFNSNLKVSTFNVSRMVNMKKWLPTMTLLTT